MRVQATQHLPMLLWSGKGSYITGSTCQLAARYILKNRFREASVALCSSIEGSNYMSCPSTNG